MPLRAGQPRRVAMLSVHTSPLDQPGTGDAGGMNVYVVETARRLAAAGTEVDVFTRTTSGDLPPSVELAPGVTVRHVTAGPFEGLAKADLPGELCHVEAGLLRFEARRPEGWYDLIHSHYWLSGQVGRQAADRWDVPLVHTMHTMARVKNASLAVGDHPEPLIRVRGEQEVVDAADRLIANTADEAADLIGLYDADPDRVVVVPPGVDLDVFGPGSRAAARRRTGTPRGVELLLFVGRIQPLKAPDVLVRAVARLLEEDPSRRSRLRVAVLGGPSGTGLERPEELAKLAGELGVADVVGFHPPVDRPTLADWYRSADLVVVPSYNESFGLVAVEAQACGTPVVAAAVGGLRTAVEHGVTGLLVPGHEPDVWARELALLLDSPRALGRMGEAAARRAVRFSWDATVEGLIDVYAGARSRSLTMAVAR